MQSNTIINLYLGFTRYCCSCNQIVSSMDLITLTLLIILSVQSNARAGPYNYVDHAKQFATKEEKGMHIVVQDNELIPSNQNTAGENAGGQSGVVARKPIGFTFSTLVKGFHIPPSGPSRGHNGLPTGSHPESSNSHP